MSLSWCCSWCYYIIVGLEKKEQAFRGCEVRSVLFPSLLRCSALREKNAVDIDCLMSIYQRRKRSYFCCCVFPEKRRNIIFDKWFFIHFIFCKRQSCKRYIFQAIYPNILHVLNLVLLFRCAFQNLFLKTLILSAPKYLSLQKIKTIFVFYFLYFLIFIFLNFSVHHQNQIKLKKNKTFWVIWNGVQFVLMSDKRKNYCRLVWLSLWRLLFQKYFFKVSQKGKRYSN